MAQQHHAPPLMVLYNFYCYCTGRLRLRFMTMALCYLQLCFLSYVVFILDCFMRFGYTPIVPPVTMVEQGTKQVSDVVAELRLLPSGWFWKLSGSFACS